MQVISGLKAFAESAISLSDVKTGIALTIGNFDGVHIGHQALIKRLVMEARRHQVKSAILTFDPHPVQILHPERHSHRMFDFEDQCERFVSLSVDYLIKEPFTKEFAEIPAKTFLRDYLFSCLNLRAIVVGYDFSFGKDREGNFQLIEDYCKDKNIPVIHEPPAHWKGSIVSSSRIRSCLKDGRLELARELLGRPYYLRGVVEKGSQRGKALGIPTANIHPQVDFIPGLGVYLSQTTWKGQVFNSITNLGVNPTFESGSQVKLETHIFDFEQNIYGESVKVELLEFIRSEKKFDSAQELLSQIYQDMAMARTFFGVNK